jgi:hypothetical protein
VVGPHGSIVPFVAATVAGPGPRVKMLLPIE